MKTTEHGIEDSRDVENVYHMRLMALLSELVRDKGYKGAARVLEVDQRTVAEYAKTGQLSRRVRQALERALQEGVGSAAARQRERNDRLETRVEALEKGHVAHEKGHDELGKEVRRRVAAVEGEVAALRRDGAQGTGAGQAGAGPSQSEAGASDRGRKPSSRPRVRREYPDLVTREPAEDDEEVPRIRHVLPVSLSSARRHRTQPRHLGPAGGRHRCSVLHTRMLPPRDRPDTWASET